MAEMPEHPNRVLNERRKQFNTIYMRQEVPLLLIMSHTRKRGSNGSRGKLDPRL